MPFGQIVIGPPGSGKTVYCTGMQQFLTGIGREVAVINLDPANDNLPYNCHVNIYDLVQLEDLMDQTHLGPNGGLIYAIEYLEKNIEWLHKKLEDIKDHYLLFDFPGQVELYTHHGSVHNIVAQLQKWDYRLTAVHLVDSFVCSQPSNYISAVLLSLSTMLQLELPHINVLSKVDLLGKQQLAFNLDFYTDVLDVRRLVDYLDKGRFTKRFKKLNAALCELIDDFKLVSFKTLNIEDKESVYSLVKEIDKSNGYVYGALTEGNDSIMMVQERESNWKYTSSLEIQEKYMINEQEDEIIDDVIETSPIQ